MKYIKTYREAIISEASAPKKMTPRQQEILNDKLIKRSGMDVSVQEIINLLERGADANAADNSIKGWGRGALWHAVYYGMSKFIPVLINAGADPNKRDDSYDIPMNRAAYRVDSDSIKYLIDGGSEVNEDHLRTVVGRFRVRDWDRLETLKSVSYILKAGVSPWNVFSGPIELVEFFEGHLDLIEDVIPKDKLKRMQRGKSAFGM
jgi:ankyrin repeat protein